MSAGDITPGELAELRRRVAAALPEGVGRGVGRVVPVGADPGSVPLPEPTPIEAGPNARPPGWDRTRHGD